MLCTQYLDSDNRNPFASNNRNTTLQSRGSHQATLIYENWNGASIYCHAVFEGKLTKTFLKRLFEYPFIDCGVYKMIAPINSANKKAQKLVKNMGFVEEARITCAVADGDVVFYTLTKHDCRFINYG